MLRMNPGCVLSILNQEMKGEGQDGGKLRIKTVFQHN